MNPDQTTDVTVIDWLIEHAGLIGLAALAIWRFAQDHLRIRETQKRVSILEERQDTLRDSVLVLTTKLDHIDDTTSKILDKIEDYDKDIVEFYKRYDLKERS